MTATLYDLAERGRVGWHFTTADGSSSLSGCGRDLTPYLERLRDGAWIIDKAPIADEPTFAGYVYRAPLFGDPSRNGAYVGALESAPYMAAVVESYGLGGPTALQVRHERSGAPGYGPMDYAPAEWHVGYWRELGAVISRYVNGKVVPA